MHLGLIEKGEVPQVTKQLQDEADHIANIKISEQLAASPGV